jgi:hypothetical protein
MAIAITTSLISAATSTPAPVQIVVTGMANGDDYTVQGSYGNHRWPVPGGINVSDGNQLVLADNRAPFNGELVYTVTVDGVVYEAAPITIVFAATTVLQSLDGQILAVVEVTDPTDPREPELRTTSFTISGRSDPVVRIDVPLTPRMQLEVEASGVHSDSMKALAATGRPMVRRNTVGLRDIPPVELLISYSHKSRLIGAVGTLRVFTMGVQVIGDPEPGTALALFDWEDFDDVYALFDWEDFDAAWSGSEWDVFDRQDWGA